VVKKKITKIRKTYNQITKNVPQPPLHKHFTDTFGGSAVAPPAGGGRAQKSRSTPAEQASARAEPFLTSVLGLNA